MSSVVLSLFVALAIGQADSASNKHLQKPSVLHQGGQHHATLLPRQQPACSNLLDANELHGEWVEGASDTKASQLTALHQVSTGLCMYVSTYLCRRKVVWTWLRSLHISSSSSFRQGRTICNRMQWWKSSVQVECPAWAQEIDCLSESLEVSASIKAKAYAEYRQASTET